MCDTCAGVGADTAWGQYKLKARKMPHNPRRQVHDLSGLFLTRLLEARYDIRWVQELLGHKEVKTSMIYTHMLNRDLKAARWIDRSFREGIRKAFSQPGERFFCLVIKQPNADKPSPGETYTRIYGSVRGREVRVSI